MPAEIVFLKRLKQASLPTNILRTFYDGVVESILTYGISTWYSSCSVSDNKKPCREYLGELRGLSEFPSPLSRNSSIAAAGAEPLQLPGTPHSLHKHLKLLPSGKWFRCLKRRTTRMTISFLPEAVRSLFTLLHLLSPLSVILKF